MGIVAWRGKGRARTARRLLQAKQRRAEADGNATAGIAAEEKEKLWGKEPSILNRIVRRAKRPGICLCAPGLAHPCGYSALTPLRGRSLTPPGPEAGGTPTRLGRQVPRVCDGQSPRMPAARWRVPPPAGAPPRRQAHLAAGCKVGAGAVPRTRYSRGRSLGDGPLAELCGVGLGLPTASPVARPGPDGRGQGRGC